MEFFDGAQWRAGQTDVSIFSFGAQCHGDTSVDDAPAINNAIAYAKATYLKVTNGLYTPFKISGSLQRSCVTKTSINATELGSVGSSEGGPIISDLNINCLVSNAPCIDGLAARGVTLRDISMEMGLDGINIPTYGIQFAKINNGLAAENIEIQNVRIHGQVSKCGYYSYATETWHAVGLQVIISNTSFAGCFDGWNRFGITSAFTGPVYPTGTANSFVGTVCVECDFRSHGVTMFYSNANQHQLLNSYICGGCVGPGNTVPYVIIMDFEGSPGNSIRDMTLDVNIETNQNSGSNSIIFMTSCGNLGVSYGPGVSCSAAHNITDVGLLSFQGKAAVAGEALVQVFETDTGMTSVTAQNFRFHNTANTLSANYVMFSNPNLWTINGGSIRNPNISSFNEPLVYSGEVCGISGSGGALIPNPTCFYYVPTPAVNRNPGFKVDQVNGGTSNTPSATGVTIIDGWVSKQSGTGSFVTFDRFNESVPLYGSPYSLRAQNNGLHALGVGDYTAAMSGIDGPDFAQFGFGSAQAKTISIDWCARGAHAGTYSASLSNNALNRSYVMTYTLNADSTEQCFHNVVPGDTTGTWTTAPGSPSFLIFTIGAGSNLNTTAGAWQAGFFLNTSGTFNFTNTSGSSLLITGVRVYPGRLRMPYLERQFSDELQLAMRWYQKSFSLGTKPAQAAGTAGAATMLAPYANGTFGTLGAQVTFPVPMVVTNPTLTFYSTGAASANCANTTVPRAGDLGAAASVNSNDKGFFLTCPTGGAGYAIGDQVQVQWTADSKL